MVKVGSVVKKMRIDRNISGNQLAKLTGISQANIYLIENNKTVPTLKVINKICDTMGVTLPEFFSERRTKVSEKNRELFNDILALTPKQVDAMLDLLREIKEKNNVASS